MTPDGKAMFAAGYLSSESPFTDVYKSIDDGNTWSSVWPEVDGHRWMTISTDATGEKLIAASLEQGVYQTLDGGKTSWKKLALFEGADEYVWVGSCSSADGQILALCSVGPGLVLCLDRRRGGLAERDSADQQHLRMEQHLVLGGRTRHGHWPARRRIFHLEGFRRHLDAARLSPARRGSALASQRGQRGWPVRLRCDLWRQSLASPKASTPPSPPPSPRMSPASARWARTRASSS